MSLLISFKRMIFLLESICEIMKKEGRELCDESESHRLKLFDNRSILPPPDAHHTPCFCCYISPNDAGAHSLPQ